MPRITPKDEHTDSAIEQRHAWVSEESHCDLSALRHPGEADAYSGNIENHFGYVRLPMGIAGPMLLRGQHAKGEFLVPMVTTEGTLVASYNRGMKAITLSGGAEAEVYQNEIHSNATFETADPGAVQALHSWMESNQPAIAGIVADNTQHGRLLRCEYTHLGSRLIVNFVYDPADAMGINMITHVSHAICTMISDHHDGLVFHFPSSIQGDKKATYYNFNKGRGRSVRTRLLLRADVIKDLLHSSSQMMLRYYRNNLEIGHLTGGIGFNMHIANGITALGLATGQDVAYVGESANGLTSIEEHGDDLLFEVTIPSLYVGTVGGGARLPTHLPCLEMLGCTGPGSALKLAEIFAATCLAGEISVLAAIASDQFVRAHNRLGRNRPDQSASEA
jgi:hydroxymethylglutaryl-CoA reductase (NADPH)